MDALIAKYAAESQNFEVAPGQGPTLQSHALQMLHVPPQSVCTELGERIRATVESHETRKKIVATCAFACYSRSKVGQDTAMRLKLREAGIISESSKTYQDVSPVLTVGAADSSAVAHVAMRAVCPELRGTMPLPGHYVLALPEQDRVVFVPGPVDLPVGLHVLAGEADLEWVCRAPGKGDLDREWAQVMCGVAPPWFKGKPPCEQTVFSPSVGQALTEAGAKRGRVHIRPGDVVVVPPGAPLWIKPTDGAMTVLHSVTLSTFVPREKVGMEESVATWRKLYCTGGICDPDHIVGTVQSGSSFRSGAVFLDIDKPGCTGAPHFPIDASLMFDLSPATVKTKRIAPVEQHLLFWTAFLLKHVAALQAIAPSLWNAEVYEGNVRKHLETWLGYARDPNATNKPDDWVKTSTERSVSETMWKLLEGFMSRLLHWQQWSARFDAVARALPDGKFGAKTAQETRRRSLLRAIREIQKLNGWAKVYQYDKWQALPSLCQDAEQLLADPSMRPVGAESSEDGTNGAPKSRRPTNWRQYLDFRLAGCVEFREAKLPETQIAALEAMLNAEADVMDFPAIDRAYHALLVLHDPTTPVYVEPSWAQATAGKGKAPKKKARAASSEDDEDDVGSEDIDDDDDEELPLGTIIRPLIKKNWNGNPNTTDKEKCQSCARRCILFAGKYCEECTLSELNEMLERSLKAGLDVLRKRKDDALLAEFRGRVKTLRERGLEVEELMQNEGDDDVRLKLFKELLDGFATLERDFEAQRITLAKVEDRRDAEAYEEDEEEGDDDEEENDEEEDEDEEEELVALPSDYDEEEDFEERESRRKKSKGSFNSGAAQAASNPQAALALDLLRFRHEMGDFIEPQREMEELCLGGKPDELAGARAMLERLRKPTSQWGVEAYKFKTKTTQFCHSLGWFATHEQADKARAVQEGLNPHLASECEFRVVEKKRSAQ